MPIITADDLCKLDHESLIRRSIELAQASREKGNHPFGSLLADLNGTIVPEAVNTVGVDGNVTAHAELNLMSEASRRFSPEELSRFVMYTSTEPCAMCAGAIFWTGVRAVVFGLPEQALGRMGASADAPNPPFLDMPCRAVFAGSRDHPTTVLGPILEAEAAVPHAGF
ncbi:MAG: nucleoside deaminase [Alphaproteobacteria bacterium]|jgi:tRNA(Arg) A34 adenosine deaminase TadA|nr:nucleoside deaminase [Alphaproteobacteria bacterium]